MTWADPDFFHSNSKVSTYFKWREINWSMCFSWHLFNLTVHLHRGVERGNFVSTPATAGNGTPETLSKTDHAPSLQNSAFCLQLPTGNLIKDLTISACSFYASAWHNGALKKPFHRTAFCAMDTIKQVLLHTFSWCPWTCHVSCAQPERTFSSGLNKVSYMPHYSWTTQKWSSKCSWNIHPSKLLPELSTNFNSIFLLLILSSSLPILFFILLTSVGMFY